MIAPDIRGALAVANLHHLSRLAKALEAMDEPADRVAQMEAQPVPPHWRQQPVALADFPPNVVPLRRTWRSGSYFGGVA